MVGETRNESKCRHWLIAGAGLVMALTLAVLALAYWQARAMRGNLDQLVDQHYRQAALVAEMRVAVRDRSVLLVSVVHARDAFEQNEAIEDFWARGTQFLVARQALLSQALSAEVQALLARQRAATLRSVAAQERVIEMVLAGDKTAAERHLVDQVIPLQNQVLAIFSKLEHAQQRNVAAASSQAKAESARAERYMLSSGLIALLLTALITGFTIRRLSHLLQRIDQSRRALDDSLRNLHAQKRALDEHNLVSITDLHGRITYANDKFAEVSGYSREELLGQNHRLLNGGHHPAAFWHGFWQTISEGRVWKGLVHNRAKDGHPYWVQATVVPFLDEQGLPYEYLAIRTEVTEQVLARQALELTNRNLRLLQAAEHALIQAQEEQEFTYAVCRAAIEVGGYALACVERAAVDGRHLQVVAADGEGQAQDVAGLCEVGSPAPLALNTGEIQVIADIAAVPDADTWRDLARRMGYASVACFPLRAKGLPAGVLSIYSRQAQRFNKIEIGLLHELAVNLVSGWESLHARAEKQRYEEELLFAKNLAEAANRAKTAFLSRTSHELRTPLNIIVGFAQCLEADTDEPLTLGQLENVRHIIEAGWHLNDLILDLLDFSQAEMDGVPIVCEPVAIEDVLDQALKQVAPVAARRGIALIRDAASASTDLAAYADEARLKRVLLNLLSNAIKFNREQGRVTIAVTPCNAGQSVRISISDSGDGISPTQQGRLFQPFDRLDAEAKQIEGTGIGLALCKHLMHLMHGEIGCESEEGQGSTFWIELPRFVLETDRQALAAY